MAKPRRLIALEEHFLIPDLGMPHGTKITERAHKRLIDFDLRLAAMDEHGIDMQVLSHTFAPWQSAPDGVRTAQNYNDHLAAICARHPSRFAGFAGLPLRDPKAAADELERAVTQLGHKGTLINHMGDGDYLDDPRYEPLWERAEALDVPIYLHPAASGEPLAVTRGYPPMATALWGWTAETGGHALRIVLGGVFERHPRARLILGHMGEALPYLQWRTDSRYLRHTGNSQLKKRPSDYIRANVLITTSGMFADPPLLCAIPEMGVDSILFSVDYPYEDDAAAVAWIANLPLPQPDIEKIAHANVERVLKL